MAFLPGCAAPMREPAVPTGLAGQATVLGVPNERFHPLISLPPLEAEFAAAVQRRYGTLASAIGEMPQIQLLAVSGGGENGAFGAGLLCGWSDHGDRPVFELVTGVSTGALTAPFAYLGSSYDPQLRTVYTELTADHVLRTRFITAALWDDAMADNSPLFKTISHYINEEMLRTSPRRMTMGDCCSSALPISMPSSR